MSEAMTQVTIWGLIPPAWRQHVWICGGYAVDPRKAGDVDLWVLGVGDAVGFMADLQEHLRGMALEVDEPREEERYQLVPGLFVSKHGTIDVPFLRLPVQVCTVETTDIREVLATFDLSVHQVAQNDAGEVVRGAEWTPTSEPIRVTRTTTIDWTRNRLLALSLRYGLRTQGSELAKLQRR